LNKREARRLLGQRASDLAEREASGQMLILDFADWYLDAKGSVTAQALKADLAGAKVLDALQRVRGEAASHGPQFEDRGSLQLQP
jgi:hypothetical protein